MNRSRDTRRFALALGRAGTVLVLAAVSALVTAGCHGHSSAANAESSVGGPYVALGDSLGAGSAADPGKGYVDLLYQDYQADLGADQLLNLSQGGATSTSLLTGGQLTTALADINAATDTKAVTIDIGGNDRTQCGTSWGLSSCPFRANLAEILGALKAALGNDPGSEPLIAMAYYNPDSGTAGEAQYELTILGANRRICLSDTGANVGANDIIFQEAAKLGVAVADTYPPFIAGGQALVSGDGLHANTAGHAVIAQAFREAVAPSPTECADTPVEGDTTVDGAFAASATQRRGLKDIYVQVRLAAQENLTAKLAGKIVVRGQAYRLASTTTAVDAGGTKVMRLRLRRVTAERKVAAALRKRRRTMAEVNAQLTDSAANTAMKKMRVRLLRAMTR